MKSFKLLKKAQIRLAAFCHGNGEICETFKFHKSAIGILFSYANSTKVEKLVFFEKDDIGVNVFTTAVLEMCRVYVFEKVKFAVRSWLLHW